MLGLLQGECYFFDLDVRYIYEEENGHRKKWFVQNIICELSINKNLVDGRNVINCTGSIDNRHTFQFVYSVIYKY